MLKKLIAITLESGNSRELELGNAGYEQVINFMSEAPEGTLLTFLPEAATEKVIVMCPGGGFLQVNLQHEGYDYAEWFDAQNITYAVLKYRLPKGNEHYPIEDITRAIQLLRQGIAGKTFKQVGTLGASIGGYMAAYAGVSGLVDFQALLYSVISMESTWTHLPSRERMFGRELNEKEEHDGSLQYRVDAKTAPAFITAAADDPAVNPMNSLIYGEALLKAGVPVSLHIYPNGGHSFGFKDSFPYKKMYLEELRQWLATV